MNIGIIFGRHIVGTSCMCTLLVPRKFNHFLWSTMFLNTLSDTGTSCCSPTVSSSMNEGSAFNFLLIFIYETTKEMNSSVSTSKSPLIEFPAYSAPLYSVPVYFSAAPIQIIIIIIVKVCWLSRLYTVFTIVYLK